MRGAISGRLFFEIDDTFFPSEEWFDFVMPVLGWWIENVMRLNLPDAEVKQVFMDGPYEIRMRRSPGSDDVWLTFWRSGRRVSERECVISYLRSIAVSRGAARGVLKELVEGGFGEHAETSALQTRLEHLMRLEANLKAHGLP